ncbi:MAG: ATP-dependent RecD-like DNA helicase [Candidatus Heteroscillospira sp.]|jgi:exodeoxyribonuclease V alpha subunit
MKCKFFRLIYPKSVQEVQNGSYTVALYMPCETVLDAQGNKLSSITVVGHYLPTMERVKVDMTGRWKKDAKYGLQFVMESYEEIIDPGKNGIVAYLSSGLIRGIGKKLAERIYNTFGDDTLAILDNDPDRILEVPGISGKRSTQLRDSYMETRSARRIITLLAPLDINAGQVVRLQKELGARAEELLKEHPYEVFEMGLLPFDAADQLAERVGIPRTAPERVAAGLLHTLELAEHKGHLCMPKERFVQETVQLLRTPGLNRMAVANVAFEMLKTERLVLYQDHVYRPVMAKAEDGVAQCVREMLQRSSLPYIGDLDDEIDRQQEELGFILAEEQRRAVKTALASPLCLISGGPGTGKTSIQRVFLNIYRKAFPDADIVCCAPTGRAARRLEQSTGLTACTVHKALNLTAGDTNTLTLPEQLDADLVLVDEVSMLDMAMTWYLFQALPPMCRLVLVGDADQLPSVGPGAVLSELIGCGRIPMVMLDKVFRQSEGSMIAENAQRIRHGDTDLQFDGDFQLWPSADIQQSARWLERLYMQEVGRYGVDNVALLTPFRHKTETGVQSMNERLRALVNPAAADKPELTLGQRVFRLGDKVMQTKNREEVSNGDIGYIRKIERDDDGFLVEVDFHDGRVVSYEDNESLSHLELAYATTVHKSQGGQYDSVLLSIQNLHGRMLKRPLIYTGLTRAKRRALIVGDEQAVRQAIETTDTERRRTRLAARITQNTVS